MPPELGNMDDESQCFFYQPLFLYGVEPNDTVIGNDNNENVGDNDTDMHLQPNYLDFSSYFMIDELWKHCVLLLKYYFDCFRFSKSVMIC